MTRVLRLIARALVAALLLGGVAAYVAFVFQALGPIWREAEYWLRVYTTLPRF